MKERLTGAIILVVLIVLLVPELLSGPKHPAPVTAANSAEEPPLRSYTINLGEESHRPGTAAAANGPAMPQPSGPEQTGAPQGTEGDQGTADSNPGRPTAEETPPAAQTASTPVPGDAGKPPEGGTGDSSPSAAPTSQSQPQPKPVAQTQKAASPGAAARPEPQRATRTAADKPAKPHTSVSTPSTANTSSPSEGGWVVQLGVFASRQNAERLALEVRVKGFKAYVSGVTNATRKLYRVRVGPASDRAAAHELQGRLRDAGRPGGTVVPYS